MQRKAYVSATAALLAVLLAGCTGGAGSDSPNDDANPGDTGTAAPVARPGKYRSLPEPCGAVGQDTLDTLLPGIQQITDPDQRDKAYQGEAALTYNTDRKVGCRWKVESADATDRLSVDFERVVSYDNAVSDDDQAHRLFQEKEADADLPEPASSATASTPPAEPSATASGNPASSHASSPASGAGSASSASPGAATEPGSAGSAGPVGLEPRVLTDLGDEAYLDDQLGASGPTAEQRTVTVVFRTSNVIVTLEYEEQPMATGAVPQSAELQDRAQKLASRLSDVLNG